MHDRTLGSFVIFCSLLFYDTRYLPHIFCRALCSLFLLNGTFIHFRIKKSGACLIGAFTKHVNRLFKLYKCYQQKWIIFFFLSLSNIARDPEFIIAKPQKCTKSQHRCKLSWHFDPESSLASNTFKCPQ